jgi:hypothetical protein
MIGGGIRAIAAAGYRLELQQGPAAAQQTGDRYQNTAQFGTPAADRGPHGSNVGGTAEI